MAAEPESGTLPDGPREHPSDQGPGQVPSQAPGPLSDQATGQSAGQAPGQVPNQGAPADRVLPGDPAADPAGAAAGHPSDDRSSGQVPGQGGTPLDELLSAEAAGPSVPPPGGPLENRELPPSDAALTTAVRNGDDRAYEELYRRHAPSVRRYARTCCRDAFTAEDLTAEVFARTLQALRAGKGPDIAVRAYLLTAVRNIAASWSRSDRREQLVDDFTAFAASSPAVASVDVTDPGADDHAMALADRSMVVEAFRRLDESDQMVLWHTAVEEEKPQELAVLLGKTANAAAVQAHRARDRLAAAFLQAHIAEAQTPECERHAGRLGALARGSLRKRASADLRAHLDTCERCSGAYFELVELNSSLRAILPGGLLVWVGAGYFAAAAAAAGVGVAAGAAGAGAAGAAGSGGAAGGAAGSGAASEGLGTPAKVAIAAAVAVAAGVGLAFALAGGSSPKPRAVHKAPSRPAVAAPAPAPAKPPSHAAGPAPAAAPPAVPVAASTPAPSPAPKPAHRAKPTPKPSPSPTHRPSPRPTPSPTPTPTPTPAPGPYYVDSLPYAGLTQSGSSSGPSIDLAQSGLVWQRTNGVTIGGTTYSRGITVYAPATTDIDLPSGCTSFDAKAGVDDMTLGLGAVRFSVEDGSSGRVLWSSGEVDGGDQAVSVHVPLGGASSVKLVVTPVSGKVPVDVADWADARFSCG